PALVGRALPSPHDPPSPRSRGGAAVLAPPPPAGSRRRGPATPEGSPGAPHRGRRSGLARGALPRGRRRGHHRAGGVRPGGRDQPPAPDPAWHRGAGPSQARVGGGTAPRPQSARAGGAGGGTA